jgi:hypothetical protein
MSKSVWIGGVLVATALVLGSAAWATVPDSGGVIHGCSRNGHGDLRVVDDTQERCRNNETDLNWNVQGPPGPSGSSHAFQATSAVAIVQETGSSIATLDVPAASYVVFGKTTLFSDPVAASCALLAGASELDRTLWTNDNTETISLLGTVDLDAAATLSIRCESESKSEAHNVQLVAMQVDAIG